ncbi:cytochrome P450, putative [Ricinus communis]|uniref:Cytochrome P450, putative n=2 Tax=Ricinus communis TaxID=3988 RepID=B9SRM6_RICCO|nr:cytochrome P450, putative [Ricinus communis]|eukprot:XP_002528645.1 cytochrome P450 76A2 [Ricinus communis]
MEHPSNSFISLILLSLSILFLLHRRRNSVLNSRFPPGPPGWPILGNLLDLGSVPHSTLTDLRQKYGDILGLRLGAINTVVILSAKAASELFKNHDLTFAERFLTITMRVHGYDQGSLALAPYGSYWRVMKRLVTVDMLVSKKINETAFVRRKCMDDMLRWIEGESYKGCGSQVARFVFLMSTNLLGNLMLSCNLVDPESREGTQFFRSITGLTEASGYANVADYLPWLKWLDPQGLKSKMERELGKALEIASQFVKERIEEKKLGEDKRKDFLDVLLEHEGNGKDEPDKISDRDLNIFILEIFIAGAETTSSSIEWAMTELLCNPEPMRKAKAELASVIGANRKVEESDIDNLPFLQAVVKETLRLHPPIPFLVPRRATQDTKFMGYHIPENTQVLVNAWAIGRDKDVWNDPLSFKPERFMGSNVDYKGQHYEFIPFGAGRRMCAGVSLAHRILHLTLGSLLHHFDWELEANVTPDTLDMRDRLGVTMRKLEPLLAVPKKCV